MKKKLPIILLLLLLLLSFLYIPLSDSGRFPFLPADKNAETWEGEKPLPQQGNNAEISIPGFKTLVFYADQIEQKVNLYNPENNICLFRMTIYADNEKVYQSGFVEPGKGFYAISLEKTLPKGEYEGLLLYECFLTDGTQLNGAEVEFNLIVEEE